MIIFNTYLIITIVSFFILVFSLFVESNKPLYCSLFAIVIGLLTIGGVTNDYKDAYIVGLKDGYNHNFKLETVVNNNHRTGEIIVIDTLFKPLTDDIITLTFDTNNDEK